MQPQQLRTWPQPVVLRHVLRAGRIGLLALAVGVAREDVWAQRGGDPGGGPLGGRGFGRSRDGVPAGTAVIRGRITAIDTGAPVRRAQVSATAAGMGFGLVATTDTEGRFELAALPAGRWTLSASKPGFVTQRLGQRGPFQTVAPLDVGDGQQVTGANFVLARGGAITGRILDDFGDPVASARVQALRSQTVEGQRRLVPFGIIDETDDTGAFRLYGLAPGDYFVSASLRANPFESNDVRAGYAPTYFPGTSSVAEAQRIRLGAGEETTVGFALQPVRTIRISGTVVSATGGPPGGGSVRLASADGDDVALGVGGGGRIQADGTFTLVNVVPGSYVLTARAGGGRGLVFRNDDMEQGSIPVTVSGEDITGIAIVTTRGATIGGVVVADGGARPPLAGVRVATRPGRAFGPMSSGDAATVTAFGAFSLSLLHGSVRLRVDGLPPQWAVKSIEVGGADVTDSPLELKGTEQITGARITLTDRIAEINGTATRGGAAATDYSVVIFADDESRWRFPSRFVRSTRGDQQGRFTVRGLPPDVSYLAAAVSRLEDGDAEDPEFLAQLRGRASSVSLREGETKTIELRVIER